MVFETEFVGAAMILSGPTIFAATSSKLRDQVSWISESSGSIHCAECCVYLIASVVDPMRKFSRNENATNAGFQNV